MPPPPRRQRPSNTRLRDAGVSARGLANVPPPPRGQRPSNQRTRSAGIVRGIIRPKGPTYRGPRYRGPERHTTNQLATVLWIVLWTSTFRRHRTSRTLERPQWRERAASPAVSFCSGSITRLTMRWLHCHGLLASFLASAQHTEGFHSSPKRLNCTQGSTTMR